MIGEEVKVIYSKRFPQIDFEKIDEECGAAFDDNPPSLTPYETFRRRLEEDNTYIVNPYKMQHRQEFIEMAIALSSEYEVDMDIKDHHYFIDVIIYSDTLYFERTSNKQFARLLYMCDRFTCFPSKTPPHELIMSLDYFTHEHYVSGRLVTF